MRNAVLLASALCGPASCIAAEAYPIRNVRLVAPFAPGGTNDTVARTIAQHLSERFGRAFVVENRTGAGGIIANETVARSTPDGHTLLVTKERFVGQDAEMVGSSPEEFLGLIRSELKLWAEVIKSAGITPQ